MAEHHRKIDLQAPADLEYLAKNISEAAQKKTDLHIPPSAASSDDAFRATVNNLVHEYVRDTLHSALPSIAINGMDATPAQLHLDDTAADAAADDAAYEAYDPRLATQLRDLYAALEMETTKVAEMRREAPAKAAQVYLEQLRTEVAQHDAAMAERERKLAESSISPNLLATVKLERQKRVNATYAEATANLEKLRGITEAVATLERAKMAAKEVDVL